MNAEQIEAKLKQSRAMFALYVTGLEFNLVLQRATKAQIEFGNTWRRCFKKSKTRNPNGIESPLTAL